MGSVFKKLVNRDGVYGCWDNLRYNAGGTSVGTLSRQQFINLYTFSIKQAYTDNQMLHFTTDVVPRERYEIARDTFCGKGCEEFVYNYCKANGIAVSEVDYNIYEGKHNVDNKDLVIADKICDIRSTIRNSI